MLHRRYKTELIRFEEFSRQRKRTVDYGLETLKLLVTKLLSSSHFFQTI